MHRILLYAFALLGDYVTCEMRVLRKRVCFFGILKGLSCLQALGVALWPLSQRVATEASASIHVSATLVAVGLFSHFKQHSRGSGWTESECDIGSLSDKI